MVTQPARLRKKVLKRRLVRLLEVRGSFESRIEIILKVAAKVDLVEGVLLRPFAFCRNLLGGALPVTLDSRPLIQLDDGLLHLLEHRILNLLVVVHLLQLKLVEGLD